MVIVVDLKTPEKHSEYSHHIRKVDNVRNGEQHVFHVENEEDFIGAQLKILAELEKGLELGHQIVGDEWNESQIHGKVEQGAAEPLETLHEGVIQQLQ